MVSEVRADSRAYKAIEIAWECGRTSDKWTRNQRLIVEDMLRACSGGDRLVEAMKGRGGAYTGFAADLIVEYATATGSMVPVVEGGVIQRHSNGVVKLRDRTEKDPPRQTDQEFQEVLWRRYGRPEAEPEPELEPEDNAVPVYGEIVSTRLEFTDRSNTPAIADTLDTAATLAGDANLGLKGFMAHILNHDREAGRMFGALRVREFSAGMQETLNRGVSDLAVQSEVEQAPAQGVTRRVKK